MNRKNEMEQKGKVRKHAHEVKQSCLFVHINEKKKKRQKKLVLLEIKWFNGKGQNAKCFQQIFDNDFQV